jgi:hypothetical protein
MRKALWSILGFSLLGAIGSGRAGSVDHYAPGAYNIRDFFVPGSGVYTAIYNYFYTSDRLNDASGNQTKSVTINPGPGPGVTLNVSPKLDVYSLSPTLIWVTPWNVGGVKFGAYIAPSFANSSIAAAVSTLDRLNEQITDAERGGCKRPAW